MRLLRTLVLCGIVVCAVAGGKLAFTAGNTVAASKVGSSATVITATSLQPAVCASNGVVPTSVRIASTATHVGTAGADLIVSTFSTNNQTISGGGGKDCIVAGSVAAVKRITMNPATGSGSVCVKGPGPGTYRYGSGCAVTV